ncbi:MAG: non-canonical purine NTP diphosphatase [Rikenellaceae bacterium]|nr:non-canonical purine NTP diphosphatase [Rikenellaceae bacterium]MDE7134789.1 non-canonical purine NTP diphosphatase [Rikenellaceae bacterium]MDE7356506.1 non-canonical purine NTP diphosphatase [Rikenellaceae bacterium]
MRKVVFATNNANKLREVQQMIDGVELVTLAQCGITEDIPETASTIEGNSSLKSHYVYDRLSVDCFADDTGLEVDALGGAPGVHSARYAGKAKCNEDNIALLLANLEGQSNRRARFRTVISLIWNGCEHLFEGVVDGVITESRHGDGGFGYDPVFMPEGYDVTFAQMDAKTKNAISHRGRAVEKLVAFLRQQIG